LGCCSWHCFVVDLDSGDLVVRRNAMGWRIQGRFFVLGNRVLKASQAEERRSGMETSRNWHVVGDELAALGQFVQNGSEMLDGVAAKGH
jgi:hypothetical protein